MPRDGGAVTTTARRDAARGAAPAEAWPLGRRLAAGLPLPGGPGLADQAVAALELGAADRLVELAPGPGLLSRRLLAADPGTWTGVEPDPLARGHLERELGGPGRRLLGARPDATGLEDGAATAVAADALLCTIAPGARAGVLAEVARLLRSGGRAAFCEPALPAGADPDPDLAALLGEAGLHLADAGGWRSELEAAGLVVIGSLDRPLRPSAPRALMREAGVRTALGAARGLARDRAAAAAARAAARALGERAPSLRAVAVVAERPLVLGMRRPRR
jgi:SAM-dependent methyltransferase